METLVKNSTLGHSTTELLPILNNVLAKIRTHIQTTVLADQTPVFKVNGNINFEINVLKFNELGICDRRRLRRLLKQCQHRFNIVRINKLFRFIHRTQISTHPGEQSIKIVNWKHDLIQQKRVTMLALKKQYEEALTNYKLEKGDFYKTITS